MFFAFAPIAQPITYADGPAGSDESGLYIPKPDTLPGPDKATQVADKGGAYAVEKFLPKVTKMFISFCGIVAFLFTITGGIRLMVSYGDNEASGAAKKQIQWSLIGLVISIFAYTIISIISSISLQ